MDTRLRALYICYLSLGDPLVHSQVVAYLAGLARAGHTVHLLTFDTPLEPSTRRLLREKLEGAGITWHSRRYHKRPSLPATVYDALVGAVAAARIVRKHDLDAIHARNHVPLATALIARRLTARSLIFDLRGLMAEEYVDAGLWREGGVPYRLTRWAQSLGLRRADGLVMLTEAVRSYLFGLTDRPRTEVIPCCADLDQIASQLSGGEAVRAELGLTGRPIMVYVGKFTGWYLEREMVDFFAVARRRWPGLAFLILTQSNAGVIEREFDRAGVPPDDYRLTSSPPEQIGRYLAAADFGISFIRRCFSKISSSPTKIGEYLGAGLPVLSSAGIGDLDCLLGEEGIAVLLEDFDEKSYATAVDRVRHLAEHPDTARRCRAAGERHLSLLRVGIPRYDRLYREVARLRSKDSGEPGEIAQAGLP